VVAVAVVVGAVVGVAAALLVVCEGVLDEAPQAASASAVRLENRIARRRG
jgi:hypothetical protein